jgi:hypothetical protein
MWGIKNGLRIELFIDGRKEKRREEKSKKF